MSEKGKKLTKDVDEKPKQETAVTTTAPKAMAVYEEMEGLGGEELEAVDLTIPRIKLLQGISREVMTGNGKVGDFVNNITEEIYGKEIEIVPIQVIKGWIIFGEKGTPDEGKVLARLYNNAVMPTYNPELIEEQDTTGMYTGRVKPHLLQWVEGKNGEKDKQPVATLFYTYLVLVNGVDFGNMSMMKSAIKTAKKFNTILKLKNEPLFCNKFKVTSEYKEDGQNKYYSPVIKPAGKSEDELRKKCYEFLMSIRNNGMKLDEDNSSDQHGSNEEKPF